MEPSRLLKQVTLEETLENDTLGLREDDDSSEQDNGTDSPEISGTGRDLLEDEHNTLSSDSGKENSCDATGSSEDEFELPSKVTDRKEIFLPLYIKPEDPIIYGKWMWFTNGNLALQDSVWIALSHLILSGEVILLESSTARICDDEDERTGVIKCYTRGDKASIKRAGLAIQDIINDGNFLYYKTNQASKNSLYRKHGDRFITEYMLTENGKLYKRDRLDRWAQVNDSEEESQIPDAHMPTPIHNRGRLLGTVSLPSQERTKIRYFYPVGTSMKEHDEHWYLFCDVTDFDSDGLTELDRAWIETKKLCDEGHLLHTSCETSAAGRYFPNPPRRSLGCVIGTYCTFDEIIESGDRLRSRISYNFPMYVKICYLDRLGRKRDRLEYMYTDDRNLYEYVDHVWKIVRKAT